MEEWQQRFIQQMMPHALAASQATGVDPRIILGQAAVESNYGKSAPGNNFFGIKAVGNQPGQSLTTKEVGPQGEYTTKQPFRTYSGMEDSVKGYADFINTNSRYKDFRSGGDIDAQLKALGQSGYATAPNYANVVGGVARNINIDPNAAPAAPPVVNTGMLASGQPQGNLPTFAQPAVQQQTAALQAAKPQGDPTQWTSGQYAGLLSSGLSAMAAGAPHQTWKPMAWTPYRRPEHFAGFTGLLG